MIDKNKSRNPYHAVGEEPRFCGSVCLYMDMLGYKKLWCQAEKEGSQVTFLRRLYEALEEGQECLLPSDNDFWPTDKDRYSIKAFTDNIVIGWPVRADAESELGSIFSSVAYFQLRMANHGFFLRGAISLGDAYVDDVVVLGSAFLEAIQGEDQAEHPRIILTESASAAARKHVSYYSRPDHAPQYRDLFQDSDGKCFVNYLETVLIAELEEGPFYQELLTHKEQVIQRLSEFRSDEHIRSKYEWVASYHNYFCDQYPQYFDRSYKIEGYARSFSRVASESSVT